MAAKYSDKDIADMLLEGKPLFADWYTRIQLRNKRGHKEREIDVTGSKGNSFQIILRENTLNLLDFSVILAFRPKDSNQLFRLRRYNGKSHEHTNHIEQVTFYDFHIHIATERYQDFGTREDAYAEPTDRYSNLNEALNCLITDANLVIPTTTQPSLFEEV